MSKKSYVEFGLAADQEGRSKTKVWLVQGTENGFTLGKIKWHGPWRQYCFFPMSDTIFNQGCLRDIADFCMNTTTKHMQDLQADRDSLASRAAQQGS